MTTSNIYNEAKSGKLTKASLEQYMANGEDIDGLNTTRKYTPLMTAVLNGHKRAVKILLSQKANVNIASGSGETALWLAASKTTKHRQNIVDLLLDAKPDLNAKPSIGSRNTPVMEAIIQFRDEGVVSRLVDAGADLGETNSRGKTAYDLAEETKQLGLKVALLPASERKKHRVPIVMRVRNFINHVITIANAVILAITGAVSALKSLLGLGGSKDSALPKDLQDCTTVDDYKKNVAKYAEDTGLERFFPKDSRFIQKLAEGLVAFKDSKSPLNTPESLKGLVQLSLYQTILYCDDSGSMDYPTRKNGNYRRIEAQKDIVERITRICSLLLPDDGGIHVRFINEEVNWDKLDLDAVHQKVGTVTPKGGTKIGTNLFGKILQPYIYQNLDAGLQTPFLICVITDGCPSGEDEDLFAKKIQECTETLENHSHGYGDKVVSFVVCQIGDDESSKIFLNKLRDKKQQLGDSVYICKEQIDEGFTDLNRNDDDLEIRLFNILTAPLMSQS